MSDQHIENLLDALFAPQPEAKASERALQALESDCGVSVGPTRPARAPRPAEPILGATELDPMPRLGPAAPDRRAPLVAHGPGAERVEPLQPAPSPITRPPRVTGSMPRVTGSMQRVTGSMQRFGGEVLEPQGEMPPLGEAPRFASGPPIPVASRGETGAMPVLSRGVTGSMPTVTGARITGHLPSVDLGPRAITMPPAGDEFMGGSEDPFASAEDPFASPEDPFASPEDLFHDVGALSFGEPESMPPAAFGVTGSPFDAASDPTAIIGSLERVVRLKMSLNDVPWAGLDPRAGFVLTQVDGSTTYEELILISGMPEAEALDLLARLVMLDVLG